MALLQSKSNSLKRFFFKLDILYVLSIIILETNNVENVVDGTHVFQIFL